MTEPTNQTWDIYWRDYEKPDYINYTPQLLDTIQTHVDLSQSRILEIGVGTGGNSSLLAQRGGQVVVLDFSAVALARAQRTAQQLDVQLLSVLADARHLPFAPESFDLVFHQGFLEHFHDPVPLVREQHRVLRKGGYLLVDVPQRYNLYTLYKRHLMKQGKWPYGGWEREFSYSELCNLLKANGFSILVAYGRGYFPRPLEMMHNLPNAEMKVLHRHIIPEQWWNPYREFWDRFERSRFGVNLLQSVGVLARAI